MQHTNKSTTSKRQLQLQAGSIVEDQQIGGLRSQLSKSTRRGQREKSLLELSGGQRGRGDRRECLQDMRGKHRGHPRREGGVGERKDGAEGALRDRLNDGRGNEGGNVGIEEPGWVKGEEIGEEAGGVGRSHGGTVLLTVSRPIQVERMA